MPDTPKKISVTSRNPSLGKLIIVGTYEGPVTRADLDAEFKHPFFGGHAEKMGGGSFVYHRYED